jgi:hypothetical protein
VPSMDVLRVAFDVVGRDDRTSVEGHEIGTGEVDMNNDVADRSLPRFDERGQPWKGTLERLGCVHRVVHELDERRAVWCVDDSDGRTCIVWERRDRGLEILELVLRPLIRHGLQGVLSLDLESMRSVGVMAWRRQQERQERPIVLDEWTKVGRGGSHATRVPIAMLFQTSRSHFFEPQALAYSSPTGCSMMITLRRACPERVDAIAALI